MTDRQTDRQTGGRTDKVRTTHTRGTVKIEFQQNDSHFSKIEYFRNSRRLSFAIFKVVFWPQLSTELSYHKQIARQLRTQYVEGIYDNPVTLKSRLTVTQGHWKRNL